MTRLAFIGLLILVFANFINAFGVNGAISVVAFQTDGKLLVGGDFTSAENNSRTSIARYNFDGTLDNSFAPTLFSSNPTVTALASQTDGKILLSGEFSSINGVLSNKIARLNSDGTVDTSFSASLNVAAEKIIYQNDGKILVFGGFTNVNNLAVTYIVRLNLDGSRDNSFSVSANSTVETATMQNDGKIIVGGQFTNINGVNCGRIARLNQNGTLDNTFNPSGNGANSAVSEIVLQADGKILIGGQFASFNSVAVNYLLRLNSDGTRDNSFISNVNGQIESIFPLQNGQILIGGYFGTINSVQKSKFAKLQSSGAVDQSFNYQINGTVFDIAADLSGKIAVAGDFNSVNGNSADSIFQIINSPTAANIEISGQVLEGKSGLSKIMVTLTDSNGISKSVLTNSFGKFRFTDVQAGETFVVSVYSKKYRFQTATQIINAYENVSWLNFIVE